MQDRELLELAAKAAGFTKRHDWDYQTNRGDLRPDTATEPLFLAAAPPAPAAEPPGYALVPIDPTDEMISAGLCSGFNNATAIYRAMIAAAGDKP